MKFLILDDSDYKRKHIKDYVKRIQNDAEFEEFCCTRDFLDFLKTFYESGKKENLKNYLLFLDWNFPFYKGESINIAEGEHVLITLKLRHLSLATVIVSSEQVDIDYEEYPMVLGSIEDNNFIWQEPEYVEILQKYEKYKKGE